MGAFFIISENNLSLIGSGNLMRFSGMYLSWIGHIAGNSITLSGYIVKMDWLPENITQ